MIFIHNRKAISNCLCQLSIMCDCDQCFSCFMKILQKFQKHILCFFIQSCKWFIQDQYFRIQRKDAGKRYFSFLPAAQMIWRSSLSFSIPNNFRQSSVLSRTSASDNPIWTGPNAISSSTLPQKSCVSAF